MINSREEPRLLGFEWADAEFDRTVPLPVDYCMDILLLSAIA